ncbi:aldo/keto reductase [Bombilactobacillus folatiphilus]|uniref:Aldo/keto reductase n=1 Tax=Bombilactobacillus folatiphilus TaxID=2923362 RepID=A0ABY4P7S7_9LACO|nr:aldo/keto reductase [Bombilactobacillus folatiphilus]UQS81763.1 aldo/keto reductase [Bombilactobacillus folatiphilus]
MKYVTISPELNQVSNLALGIMRWGDLTIEQATAALIAAQQCGINFLDSADIYSHGRCEEVFGQAFQMGNFQRDDWFIQSKVGIVPHKRYDFSKQHLLDSVDTILSRMQIDYLDLLVLHRPDPLMDLTEIQTAFDILIANGKVHHFGVSNFNAAQIKLLQSGLHQKLVVNQLQFSLAHTAMIDFGLHTNLDDAAGIDRDDGTLEYCQQHQLTVQAWSPFQHGFSVGTFIDNPHFGNLNVVLDQLAHKYQTNKNAVAAAWILRHPAKWQVILGTTHPDHIINSAQCNNFTLTRQEWYNLYLAAGHDLP